MKTLRLVTFLLLLASAGSAQAPAPAAAKPAPLFAALFRTGPKWDAAKPPGEQPFFREHSANLQRLRQSGTIVMGARYADVGLIVVAAENEAEARKLFDGDPSLPNGTFRLDVHPFAVIYGGTVGRPQQQQP